MFKAIRKLNYRHYISMAITLSCIAFSIFRFSPMFFRLLESLKDFGLSIAFYFFEMINLDNHGITPTVTKLSELQEFNILPFFLPENFELFKIKISIWFQTLLNFRTYAEYFGRAGNFLVVFSQVFLIIMPFILVLFFLLKNNFKRQNNDYNKDSRPLQIFKRISSRTFHPVKNWVISFMDFLNNHSYYPLLWLIIWAYNLNLFSIFLSALAYFFYFSVSIDLLNLYIQVYKLLLDLVPAITFLPLWLWIIAGLWIFDRYRKNIADRRLRSFESLNRQFIQNTPIVLMIVGTMGKKKTTMLTDIALSQQVMFRDKAFEMILENDLKFPNFPWINMEIEFKQAMKFHQVYNLATAKKWLKKKAMRFNGKREKCFDYDFEKYGLFYDDKLKEVNLFDVLEIYVQLYFIYVIQSSLLLANYSIREDNLLSDLGNFPMWNSDFFDRDSRLIDSFSRHSHIIDFDSLRLGKTIVEDSRMSGAFEFGVVVMTEAGKERGNMLDTQEMKKYTEDTNQKNDLFNLWEKMVRHSATVDNFPFVKVIMDEQRPMSLGADARELCEIIHIRESNDSGLSLPFFAVGELLYDLVLSKFERMYYEYRFLRADNTLFLYLFKNLSAKLQSYYKGIQNRYGFTRLTVQIESGTMDGNFQKKYYYLMNKKIYSKRFSTDCFSDYFNERSEHCSIGLNDIPEYLTEKATFRELLQQNSYFMNDLLNVDWRKLEQQQIDAEKEKEAKFDADRKLRCKLLAEAIAAHADTMAYMNAEVKTAKETAELAEKLFKYNIDLK